MRLDMMDEAHVAVLWKLDKESEEKKVSRNKLILQHLYEYYQQKENEEKETTMVVTKEYVDGRINAVKCEVLEEVLQVITGGIQEKTQQWRKEAEPNEETAGLWKTDNKTKEKAETDIFSDPVIMAAAQKWG